MMPMTSLEIRLGHVPRGRGERPWDDCPFGSHRCLRHSTSRHPAAGDRSRWQTQATSADSHPARVYALRFSTKRLRSQTHLNASLARTVFRPPRQCFVRADRPSGFCPTARRVEEYVVTAKSVRGCYGTGTPSGAAAVAPVAAAARCGRRGVGTVRRQQSRRPTACVGGRTGSRSTFRFVDGWRRRRADVHGLYSQVDWTAELGVLGMTPQMVPTRRRPSFAGVNRRRPGSAGEVQLHRRGPRVGPRSSRPSTRATPATGPFDNSYFAARQNWTFRGLSRGAMLNAFDMGTHHVETLADDRVGGRRRGRRRVRYVVGRVLRHPPP